MQAPRKWIRPALSARYSAGEALVAIVRASLDQIAANAPGAAAGRDPECLHQLRIGVRRLRSALRAFRKLLRRKRADAIDQPWREILRSLGEARDWNVFREQIEAGPLQALAGERCADAQRTVRALLTSSRFRAAQRQTRAWARGGPWRRHADPERSLRRFARPALERLDHEVRGAARDIDWRDAARRHRVRIRVKRMRYGCEFLAAPFHRRRVRAFAGRLHRLQDLLGELNDIRVQRVLLRGLLGSGNAGKRTADARSLRARLAAREKRLIAALGQAWAAFESGRPLWRPGRAARA
jgi:CHAD domain-containing protein